MHSYNFNNQIEESKDNFNQKFYFQERSNESLDTSGESDYNE